MSAQIYADIRAAIAAYYPEKLEEFKASQGRENIIAFLDRNFPLDHDSGWVSQLLIRIPDILKARKQAEDNMS